VKIDLTTEIKMLDDSPFHSGKTEQVQAEKDDGTLITDEHDKPIMVTKQIPLTIRDLLVGALTEPDQQANWKVKIDRASLAQRIYQAAQFIQLKPEQIVELKDLIGKIAPAPVVVLRVAEILDPTDLPEPPPEASDEDQPPATPEA
jgi:hypothetical protein